MLRIQLMALGEVDGLEATMAGISPVGSAIGVRHAARSTVR